MAASDMQLLMTSQIESGNVQVDVAALPNDQLYPYVSEGLVEDLSEFGSEIDPTVPESLLEGGRVDGRLLFTPFRGNVQLTYYRTDVFDELGLEPPATFADWRTVCQAS
jgi:ABC-type glycerol-3-phosphate transport system substrate-binding protein